VVPESAADAGRAWQYTRMSEWEAGVDDGRVCGLSRDGVEGVCDEG
jgi:hypothetical protein